MNIFRLISLGCLVMPLQMQDAAAVDYAEDLNSIKEDLYKSVRNMSDEVQKSNSELFKRITQLEEEIRNLQGNIQHVEHTSRQLLAKINNVNEDMSYRFAQMEKNSSEKGSALKSIKEYVAMVESGKIKEAREGLLNYIKHKQGNDKGIAYYWLGKSYMSDKAYKDAGTYFLKSYKYYPTNDKASESLLGLAVSLRNLDKKNRACSILDRLDLEYPSRSDDDKRLSQDQRNELKCK